MSLWKFTTKNSVSNAYHTFGGSFCIRKLMQGLPPFYLFSERTDNNASNFNDSKGYLVNRQENQKTIYILLGILSVFVIWLALMVAGCYEENIKLFELLDRLTVAMNNHTHITFNEYSLKAVLIFLFLYAMGIGVYFSSRENRRPGEEHGSARWGNVKSVVRKYEDKDNYSNIILSQNMRLGLNAKKHRRNLNVLVVGGSGAGKTRFYAKPNLMQCNTSFIVADPNG